MIGGADRGKWQVVQMRFGGTACLRERAEGLWGKGRAGMK